MEFEKEQVWRRLANTGEHETYYSEATDAEREVFRQWVKSLMWEQVILVEFVKADGATRTMNCTLNSLHGAVYPGSGSDSNDSDKKQRKQNQHVCSVWDVDKNAWRSFRWDRLKRIDFKIG